MAGSPFPRRFLCLLLGVQLSFNLTVRYLEHLLECSSELFVFATGFHEGIVPREFNMPHPLDGARLKVVRAYEHLDGLKLAIADYEKRNPYSVNIGTHPDYRDASANVTAHPESRISAIIGDCLQNLNSALDYVMWEVAGTFAGRPLVPGPTGKDTPHFPIFITPANFTKYIARLNDSRGWNYKIPNSVITTFDTVQPYQTGYDRLWIFKMVVNADKHRLPLVTEGNIDKFEITVSRVKVGAHLPPQLIASSSYYASQVKTSATVHVTWQDPFMPREPVARTMQDFVERVADIVPRFDAFVL